MKNLKTHHTSCSQSHENETMGGKEKQKKMICIWPNGLFLKEKKGKQINNWQTPTHKKMETWRRKRKASIGSKTCALSICNPPKWLSEVKVYLSSTKKDASKNSSSLSEEEAGAWMPSAIATAKNSSCKLQIFRPSYWSLRPGFRVLLVQGLRRIYNTK